MPIASIDIDEVVDHYDKIIRNFDRPPDHLGSLVRRCFTQILLDHGLGAVGVGVPSADEVAGWAQLRLSQESQG